MSGYHLANIPRGQFGELSKIEEELAEIKDAIAQGCKIMELVELSDLYAAIHGYLIVHHPGFTMEDLKSMAVITDRAFRDRVRVSRD